MLLDELPEILHSALTPSGVDSDGARRHVETVEDAEHLRDRLADLGLVAFVADGAILPRESGTSDRPLRDGAVPFSSPEEFRVSVKLPNRGEVRGMGIPEGVTLIAGAAFTARARSSKPYRGASTITYRVTAASSSSHEKMRSRSGLRMAGAWLVWTSPP